MSATRIVYQREDGTAAVALINTACGLTADEIAERIVPAGSPYRLVNAGDIPDDLYADAWVADFTASAEDFKVTIDPVRKAETDKRLLLEAVEDWFVEMTAPGWETPGGWRLGLSQEDVSLLTGNYVLAQQAAAIGAPLPPIVDMNGEQHTFSSINEMTELMLAYGQARASISAEYAAKKQAILDGQQP